MPRGDKTGPMGQGPITGRGLGFCAGYDTPGFTKNFGRGFGRGMGQGFGRGMRAGRGMGQSFGRGMGGGMERGLGIGRSTGWGFGRGMSFTKEDEVRGLKAQADYLKQAQEDINSRLSELENAE